MVEAAAQPVAGDPGARNGRARLASPGGRQPAAPDELAAPGFASTEEAIGAVLRVVAQGVGARSSFLNRVDHQRGRAEVLAAYNAPGGCGVAPGAVLALPDTY